MTAKKILFRVDASERIGSGHVMRCLTLANALRAETAECVFVAASMPESLFRRVQAAGHEAILLPEAAMVSDRSVEDIWSEMEQAHDSAACLEVIRGCSFDWVIVDHYGLDRKWESVFRDIVPRIMVIDDLANRPHDCDLILDQNFGREPLDYDDFVPPSAKILCGPEFALLRPEFAAVRPAAMRRREGATFSRILISFGGSDTDGLTGRVLSILNDMVLPEGVQITAVLGPLAGRLDAVRAFADTMRYPTEVLVDVPDMAVLMSECDLAIGAAGTTAWERCCLGLPSILVVLAENQRPGAEALARAGLATLVCMEPEKAFASELISAVATYVRDRPAASVEKLVRPGIDGKGCVRVVEELARIGLATSGARLRKLDAADLGSVLDWRNNDSIRHQMLSQDIIDYSAHVAWFEAASINRDRRLLILEVDGVPSGYVHFKIDWNHSTATWGFYKSPSAPKGTGRILGQLALDFAFHRLGLRKVWAEVISGNEASASLHCALGFTQEGLMRQAYKIAAEYVDVKYYGLLRQDWKRGV